MMVAVKQHRQHRHKGLRVRGVPALLQGVGKMVQEKKLQVKPGVLRLKVVVQLHCRCAVRFPLQEKGKGARQQLQSHCLTLLQL